MKKLLDLLTVRLGSELLEKFSEYCKKHAMSRSAVVRLLVEKFLKGEIKL